MAANKQIAKALRAAVPHLSKREGDRKEHLICFAIPNDIDGEYAAMDMIGSRLGTFSSVELYLKYTLKIPKRLRTYKNVQEFRHRWLAALIKEFESK